MVIPGFYYRVRTTQIFSVAPSVLGKDRQLGGHITGALNCGVSRKEIVELMVQLIFTEVTLVL